MVHAFTCMCACECFLPEFADRPIASENMSKTRATPSHRARGVHATPGLRRKVKSKTKSTKAKSKTDGTAPGVRPGSACKTDGTAPGVRPGSASSLPGESFTEFLAHCKKTAPVWLHIFAKVDHALGNRVTETLELQGDHVDFKKGRVLIHGLKGHGIVYKPLVPHARKILAQLKKKAVTTTRKVKRGACDDATVTETWRWSKGYLFPRNCDQKQPAPGGCGRKPPGGNRITKDTVSKAIIRARKTFKSSRVDVSTCSIRSHSFRHRWINDAKNAGLPKEVAMKYCLIKDEDTYMKVYGRPTMEQAGDIIKKSKMVLKMPKAA